MMDVNISVLMNADIHVQVDVSIIHMEPELDVMVHVLVDVLILVL